ncbi:MAG TPA: HAD family phosphatase, partial [Chloroflexia bacterium]|nr:HAD family phosphatase [Chloroflexia bacterium]
MTASGEAMGLACVWDMDDVLISSGMAHFAAWQDLGREAGHPFTLEQHRESLGRRTPDILRLAWGITGPPDQVARWTARKEELFRAHAAELRPLPGAVALVRALHAAGWRQAVGSSGPAENVALSLAVLGVASCFAAVVTGDDITHGKPDPEIFRIALQRLGVAPARSLVIEDAVTGVQAGKAAGAFTIGVTHSRSREDLEQAGADLVIASLWELSPPQ